MEFESIRPVLTGILGGAVATWLTSRWSRKLPETYNSKSRETMMKEHQIAIWSANALFLAGLIFGISLYQIGGFVKTDYRPLLWGYGLASVLPLLAISMVSAISGRNVREAYIAFSWGQGAPLWATYGILGAGVVAFLFSVFDVITKLI